MTIASKRKNIEHLQKMSDIQFYDLLVSGTEITKASLKVDGAGGRFGKDKNGIPFFEGSRTGPIFDKKEFSDFIARMENPSDASVKRSVYYMEIFDLILGSDFMKKLPSDTKVFCELFYNPMGEDLGDRIRFVNIAYPKDLLGSELTIVPFHVTNTTTGELHKDNSFILAMLYDMSSVNIRIVDPKLSITEKIKISDIVEKLPDRNILISRKAIDKTAKDLAKSQIEKIKHQIAEYLLNHPAIQGKDIMGTNIEGIVFEFGDRLVKVTTPEFKELIRKSHS